MTQSNYDIGSSPVWDLDVAAAMFGTTTVGVRRYGAQGLVTLHPAGDGRLVVLRDDGVNAIRSGAGANVMPPIAGRWYAGGSDESAAAAFPGEVRARMDFPARCPTPPPVGSAIVLDSNAKIADLCAAPTRSAFSPPDAVSRFPSRLVQYLAVRLRAAAREQLSALGQKSELEQLFESPTRFREIVDRATARVITSGVSARKLYLNPERVPGQQGAVSIDFVLPHDRIATSADFKSAISLAF